MPLNVHKYEQEYANHTGGDFSLGNAGGLFIVAGLFESNYHIAVGFGCYRSGYFSITSLGTIGNIKFQTDPNIGGAEIYATGSSAIHVQNHAGQATYYITTITTK